MFVDIARARRYSIPVGLVDYGSARCVRRQDCVRLFKAMLRTVLWHRQVFMLHLPLTVTEGMLSVFCKYVAGCESFDTMQVSWIWLVHDCVLKLKYLGDNCSGTFAQSCGSLR